MFSCKRVNSEAQGIASFPSELLDAALKEGSPTKVSKRDSLWYGQGRRPATKREKHAPSDKDGEAAGVDDLSGWISDNSRSTTGSNQVDEGLIHGGHSQGPWSAFDDGPSVDLDSQPPADTATDPGSSDSQSDDGLDSNHDEELEVYVDSVNSEVAGFDYIGGKVFVVQGWDSSRRQTTDVWYHLAYEVVGPEELSIACTCRAASATGDCIHIRYFSEYHVEDGDDIEDPPAASVFLQRVLPCGNLYSMFSVESMSVVALRGRAIVTHKGVGSDTGTWKCSKDSTGAICFHIKKAMALLPEDLSAIPGVGIPGAGLTVKTPFRPGSLSRGPGSTISHLPVMPPPWARLSTDPVLYNDAPSIRTLDTNVVFPIDLSSSCACVDGFRAMYHPSFPTRTRLCKLYTILTVCEVQIQVQPCPRCPYQRKRYIGPDLRSYGVFNYNNKVLLTHELLDEYTSLFTGSETPFHAFRNHLVHRFQRNHLQFMGEDLFRSAWFAYVSLQQFRNDMACTQCGPAPTTVIWDGITLAFGRKHVTNSLRPPTTVSEHSLTRSGLRYHRKQHVLSDALLRRRLRTALEGPSLDGLSDDLDEELGEALVPALNEGLQAAISSQAPSPLSVEEDSNTDPFLSTPTTNRTFTLGFTSTPLPISTPPRTPSKNKTGRVFETPEARKRQALLAKEHLNLLDWVRVELEKQGGDECPELARLLVRFFGPVAYIEGKDTRTVAPYKNLFKQITAEESVLQLVNYKQWESLCEYLYDPVLTNRYKLVSVPAFHRLLGEKACDIDAINSVLRWVAEKARTVMGFLVAQASVPLPLADPVTLPSEEDWRKTGCYYNMPAIRHRPKYPKLDEADEKDRSAPRGDRCGKYYSEYGEKRLTGGIMVCWCPHSVCYGFHCIPACEGRNDVFSAMVTRWPVAPERVVYDFACALGPYCMLREPQFFGKTSFVIDHFHAAGHTKCSPAAFLSEYANADPKLSSINSSAAECGNGALRRIRKSVSYMSQERAIIYTRVFLSIWNRVKTLKASKKTRS